MKREVGGLGGASRAATAAVAALVAVASSSAAFATDPSHGTGFKVMKTSVRRSD